MKFRQKLKLHESLSQLMDRALLLKEKNYALRRGGAMVEEKRWGRTRGMPWRKRPQNHKKLGSNHHGRKTMESDEGEKKAVCGRRITQAELQERSRKGLCFKCGEKWGPEHMQT